MAGSSFELSWDDSGGAESRELTLGELVVGRQADCDIVLSDPQASRRHARIRVDEAAAVLEDLGSRNGVFVNGERVEAVELQSGDEIRIGSTTLRVSLGGLEATQVATSFESSTVFLDQTQALEEPAEAPAGRAAPADGTVPPDLLEQSEISEEELRERGVEVRRVKFLALGGGVGSFTWVDMLRCCGVEAQDIAVVGNEEHAIARYRRLCANSQIPDHERLRSHSESCPDNVWGFPGYALREAWGEFRKGHPWQALRPLRGVFGEPVLSETWTPRGGDVFASLDREEARIGWSGMVVMGRIRAIRKSREGRLLAVISQSDDERRRHLVFSARYVHLAVGYPAIQLLPELGEHRERTGDRQRVVNAYEEHDHVYRDLRANGGTVLLRGRGIVASRIIQRLVEEREHNTAIQIIHLHRSRLSSGNRFGRTRRVVVAQFEMQPFNWPKACWGGELRGQLEQADDLERKRLLEAWGGTTTANRGDWQEMIADGTREGWYRAEFGTVDSVELVGEKVISRASSRLGGGGTLEWSVDYVIDCTGLVAGIDRSPLLSDFVSRSGLPLNALQRLSVSNDFEVEAMRHGDARLYAAGAVTLGGPFAAVDSFLGLQYAALRAVDAIRALPSSGVRRLNGLYSVRQWTRWARGVAP
ncbi:MAG: FHA domain-containing protein [Chloroflexi bacterium]|nr:FHA domain-containing protein [Chloroflexota bacterium]